MRVRGGPIVTKAPAAGKPGYALMKARAGARSHPCDALCYTVRIMSASCTFSAGFAPGRNGRGAWPWRKPA